jgi:hypothetical protein
LPKQKRLSYQKQNKLQRNKATPINLDVESVIKEQLLEISLWIVQAWGVKQ